MSAFTVGDRIKVTVTFRDDDNDLFDPTGVEFRVRNPNRATETFVHPDADISNPSTGVWVLSYLIEDEGQHFVSAESTSVGEEAVVQSKFSAAPDLSY